MNRYLGLMVTALFFAAAPIVMAQGMSDHSDHVEVGVFADYFRFSATDPAKNFLGVGARAGFNLNRNVQLEGEMAYDFKRNFTNICSTNNVNCIGSTTVNSSFRTLHGLFGPKLQTGSGPFRFFVTGKVGFDNFTVDNRNAPTGFSSAVGLDRGKTDFAVYPAAGIEGFAGPIGIRLEAGDEVYFDNGAHNNLKVTIGPQLRF
jgi:hypothetical protein